MFMSFRPALIPALAALSLFMGCARNDLDEPPMPLGDFALGHNIAVAGNVQKVPISRTATPEEWTRAIRKAVDARFGETRYQGSRLYNIGISVDAYALAPPGIPIIAAPQSILVVSANIWDDATRRKLNGAEGHQITTFEDLSGARVIGTGLTRTKEEQMAALAHNAVKKLEDWLLEHPGWFGMTEEEQAEALAARKKRMEEADSKPGAHAGKAEKAGEETPESRGAPGANGPPAVPRPAPPAPP